MFKMKNYISSLLRKFGYEIQKHSSVSQSLKEPYYHFRDLVNKTQPVIFDVGAHIGDTAEQFRSSFPESWIHTFEPCDQSFMFMEKRFGKMGRTYLNNIAIGDSSKDDVSMYVTHNEGSSSLLKPKESANKFWKGNPLNIEKKIKVRVHTIDEYCEEKNVSKIDILKIDVQGNEIKVLEGAKRMLKKNRINLIFTEISIAPNYEGQSEIDEIIRLLRTYGYRIFNFFKMKHINGRLIECDVLFYLV